MEEQPHGNAPLRNARQGAAARGIHDLQALADGELTPRGSPEASPRRPPGRPSTPKDTTTAERVSKEMRRTNPQEIAVSDPSTGSGSCSLGVRTHPPSHLR